MHGKGSFATMKHFTGRHIDDIFPTRNKLSERVVKEIETLGKGAFKEHPDVTSLFGDNISWELNIRNKC